MALFGLLVLWWSLVPPCLLLFLAPRLSSMCNAASGAGQEGKRSKLLSLIVVEERADGHGHENDSPSVTVAFFYLNPLMLFGH